MSFSLHHSSVQQAAPRAWILAFHGVFGRGSNLRSFAKALTLARPEWGVELLDLREHGRSLGAPAPHTMDAAAHDVEAVGRRLEAEGKFVGVILGHSLGGKVALHVRKHGLVHLQQTWILDSPPGARPGAIDSTETVPRVLRMLESMPESFDSRDCFVQAVVQEGYPQSLAVWLAMNLERTDSGEYALSLRLPAVRELLADYYADDAWSLLSSSGGELHFVVASRSPALGDEERARLRAQAREGQLEVHEIDAGHWLHVENMQDLVRLVAFHLPTVDER